MAQGAPAFQWGGQLRATATHAPEPQPNSKKEIENARGLFFQEILRGRDINAYHKAIHCLSFLDKVLPISEVA